MDGNQINDRLERGFMRRYDIRALVANNLNFPSDPNCINGFPDSVTQQAHRINAIWNDANSSLAISLDINGPGYWIPYLGNGFEVAKPPNVVTLQNGLGTYTPVIPIGGPISWVATGPFSGCHSAAFSPVGGGVVFAHVITPTAGRTADSTNNQITHIAALVNAAGGMAIANSDQTVSSPNGAGYVFWTLLNNNEWWRRVVWVLDGNVVDVDKRERVL